MNPYEIALRCTKPLSLEEARRDLHDDRGSVELPDPCPIDRAEMNESVRRIEGREANQRLEEE
jgi:hypothetical protein